MLNKLQLEQSQKAFFQAVSRIYDSVLIVNLTQNQYTNSNETLFMEPSSLENLMTRVKKRSHVEDEQVLSRLQPDYIKTEFQNGREEILEEIRQKLTGIYHWYSVRIEKIKDVNSCEVWAVVFIKNIDKEKETQRQLEQANERIKREQELAFDSIPGFVIKFKIKGFPCELEAAEKFYDYWGTKPEDYKSMAFYKMDETDLFYFLECYLEEMQKGEKISVNYRAKNAEHKMVYIHLEARCIGLENGYPYYIGVMIDISKNMQVEEKLLKQAEFLQSIYDTVVVAIQQIRREDIQALTINQATLNLLECNKYEYRKVLNTRDWKIKDKKDFEKIRDTFYKLSLGEQSTPMEVCIFTEKKKECWISLTLKRILNYRQEDTIQLEYNDITELKLLREKEEELYLVQKSNQAKNYFLSKISHEMKTPMNGIIGTAEIALKLLADKVKVKEYLEKILSASKFLQSFINDILDMSKIENGKIQLSPEVFQIEEWLKEIKDIFFVVAEQKKVLFRIQTYYSDCILVGDKMRLGQVLVNLIGNAIKFTPTGGIIELSITQEKKTKQNSLFTFQVKDTGIGIKKEKQEKIFEVFEQVDSSITKKFGGSGLGLTISQSLVEMMGGKIEVLSEEGEGAEFYFTIPLETRDTIKEKSPKVQDKKEYNFNGTRILVAEDNPLNAEIAETLLSMAGCSVEVTRNGEQAVAVFEKNPNHYYQLILMDIQMPKLNGLEAAKKIRLLEKGKEIPILAMSANDFDTDKQRAKEVGIDGYIAKPIQVDIFYQEIEEKLKRGEAHEGNI